MIKEPNTPWIPLREEPESLPLILWPPSQRHALRLPRRCVLRRHPDEVPWPRRPDPLQEVFDQLADRPA